MDARSEKTPPPSVVAITISNAPNLGVLSRGYAHPGKYPPCLHSSITKRAEVFEVLESYHEHNVDKKDNRRQTDIELVPEDPDQKLVEINVEPWGFIIASSRETVYVVLSGNGLTAAP